MIRCLAAVEVILYFLQNTFKNITDYILLESIMLYFMVIKVRALSDGIEYCYAL